MMKKHKLYYLASPYSHANPEIKKARAEAVTESAVDLLRHGVFVFAPISYNEPWERFNLPGDWNFWCDFDKTFVERCDGGVIVLMLDGWEKSIGVAAEIDYAISIGLPVFYATQEQIKQGNFDFIKDSTGNSSLYCQHSKL